MRKVLFRGFQPDENGNQKIFINGKWIKGFWVYGYYIKRQGAVNAGFANPTNIIEDNETGIEYDVIPSTVSQFTDLYDGTEFENLTTEQQGLFLYPKNGGKHEKQEWKGNLIFEGDIVDITYEAGTEFEEKNITCVKYQGGAFTVDIAHQDYDVTAVGWAIDIWDEEDAEYTVIGNIFENPELLEAHHD